MTRKLYIAWAMALPLIAVGCQGTTETLDTPTIQTGERQVADDGQRAVAFEAYLNRATTRAGATGELVTSETTGKADLQTKGFGVMAYHTGADLYGYDHLPDFMYNERVTWTAADDGGHWGYDPVKYWPNQTAGTDSHDDRVSFFAYAPWVAVDASTGRIDKNYGDYSVLTDSEKEQLDKVGITGLTANTAATDPRVRYAASLKPSERVDFCWADPKMDETRPATLGTTLDMQFHHALASLNVLVDAYVDKDDNTNTPAGDTRIWIRSVSFEGFAMQGSFNLHQTYSNSADPEWNEPYTDALVSNASIQVKDGRSDGLEGRSASLNERLMGLNPALVQTDTYDGLAAVEDLDADDVVDTPHGVYNNLRNLFDVSALYETASKPTQSELNDTSTEPIYVIPTDRPLRVTIAYDIETRAAKLPGYLADGATHGIKVQNVISATVQTAGGDDLYLHPGKNYTVRLHLGINSVQVAATVSEWGATADAEELDVPMDDLPINQIMQQVYVNPWDEQEEVAVTVPMSDLSDLLTYFKAQRTGDDDISGQFLGLDVDKNGHIKDVEGTDYDGSSVGQIVYISTDGTDVDSNRPGSRILVMAKESDFGSTVYSWCEMSYKQLEGYTDINAVNGWSFTDDKHAQKDTTTDPETDKYPAAKACYDLQNTKPIELASGVLHWFMPSKRQMELMGCNDGTAIGMASVMGLGTDGWWSATEQDANTARCYVDGKWTVAQKEVPYKVRPVFAY